MNSVTIYHNPRCSKSRQTLQLIKESGNEAVVIKYLETPPTVSELMHILTLLDMQPQALLRKTESLYKDPNMGDESLTHKQLLTLMHKYPKVIERPIVLANNKAAIGRPPESVLDIL